MSKSTMTVGELVNKIQRGELVLPEIQRRYVWRATRVRDLLDSLYRGYPSGSILLWETDQAVPTQKMGVGQEEAPTESKLLLLDGQQRLTGLSAVLRGEKVQVKGRRKPVDILFNLDHPEGGPQEAHEVEEDGDNSSDSNGVEESADDTGADTVDELTARLSRMVFVVSNRRLAALPNWVSASDVFSSTSDRPFLARAGVTSLEDPRYDLYTKRLSKLRSIREYPYTVNILERSYGYEEVTDIFVRVNSLGVKLRSSDLAMAQISARWRNCLPVFEEFQEELEEDYWTFDTGFLLRAAVIFATKQCRFKTAGTIPIPQLQEAWGQAKDGLRFACSFLQTRADMEEETVLSSPFIVLPVMLYSQLHKERLSEDQQQALIHWVYVANMRAWYSGSAETTLDEDLSTLFKGGSPQDLTRRILDIYGRLDVRASDFVGRGQRNALFPMAFLALRARDAKDWYTGVGISLILSGRNHKIQWHHIMPKALLNSAGYDKNEINEIANMAFIGGATNRRIGKRDPFEYLSEVADKYGDAFLFQHAIPADRDLWKIDRFRDFLVARRELLALATNELLAKVTPAEFVETSD
ncbi:DUF262 domain-containing protein [Verrucomicrobiota bacterium]